MNRLRFFIGLGTTYTNNFVRDNSYLINSNNISGNVSSEDPNALNSLLDQSFGYSGGMGINYNINYKNIISFEVRYNMFNGDRNSLRVNQMDLMMGFSF